jgi:hypothetical protein
MKIYTVSKDHAPTMNRKERRRLAKKIRRDLAVEKKSYKN